jgi:short-subunit dehydrogenase
MTPTEEYMEFMSAGSPRLRAAYERRMNGIRPGRRSRLPRMSGPGCIQGAVALVTGGSGGIGRAVCLALASQGAEVILTYHTNRRAAEDVAKQADAQVIHADLADSAGPAVLAAVVKDMSLSIDLLVCCHGTGWYGLLADMTAPVIDELIDLHFRSPVQLARLLAPSMSGRGGRIVFVASIAGAVPVRGEAVYAAAKAGLASFAESLRYEMPSVGSLGVTVVHPGIVDTAFHDSRRQYPRGTPAPVPPERVAAAVVRAIERDQDEVYVPARLRTATLAHRLSPWLFRQLYRLCDRRPR